jgi:Carboxypeptidase regulatory-like domain
VKPRPLIAAALVLAFSALLINLSTEKASAQDIYGRISGWVTDTQGHTIPDADVTIVNESTGVALSLKTNSDGFYVDKELAVGTYSVQVTKDQFKVTIVKGIVVHAGARQTADVVLDLGAKTETVTVQWFDPSNPPAKIIGIQPVKIADSSPVVSATLSPTLSPVKAGSVKVHIAVENISDHQIGYGTPLITFDVRDENGKLPPETPLGCTLHFFSPCHNDGALGPPFASYLVPHKKSEEDEDLTLEYDLSRPGTYTVVGYVRYFSDGAPEYFRTNKIKITVR